MLLLNIADIIKKMTPKLSAEKHEHYINVIFNVFDSYVERGEDVPAENIAMLKQSIGIARSVGYNELADRCQERFDKYL